MDEAETQNPPKVEIWLKSTDLPARVRCIGKGAKIGPTRCGKRTCPRCLTIAAEAAHQEQYQRDTRHAIVNFVKIATVMKAEKKWHIDQEHGVAGIFLSLAKNLRENVSLRKDLSYYGALRVTKSRAHEKRKMSSVPGFGWDKVEADGKAWFRATADPGNYHYAEFVFYFLRRRDLFVETHRAMGTIREPHGVMSWRQVSVWP